MSFTKTTKASVVDSDRTVDKHSWKKTMHVLATIFLTLVVIAATISIISSTGEKHGPGTVNNVEINIDVDGKHFRLSDENLSAKTGDSIKVHVTDPSDQTEEETFFNIDNVIEGMNLTAAMAYINSNVTNAAKLRRMLRDDAKTPTLIDQFILTEPYGEAIGAYCIVETNECELLNGDEIPLKSYVVRRFVKLHPSELSELKQSEKIDAFQRPEEPEKSPAEGDDRLRRGAAVGCGLLSSSQAPCDAKAFCKKQHLTFAYHLARAGRSTNSAFDSLKSSKLTPCDKGNGYLGRCDAGKGDVEDMLQHVTATGSICSRVHSNIWRRTKHKAASIAQGFMDAREGCNGYDWMAVVDLVNNEQGAKLCRDLTRDVCMFRIFGRCRIRKQVPPSALDVAKAAVDAVPTATHVRATGSPPSDWSKRYRGKPMFVTGPGYTDTSCYKGCSGRGRCVNKRCVCKSGYKGTACAHKVKKSRCVPASAQIETTAGWKDARDVKVGDRVRTPQGWEDVYLQGHADATTVYEYAELILDSGHAISLSPDHYIRAGGRLRLAKGVKAGMNVTVRTDDGRVWDAKVTHVQKRMQKGAYNPYTLSGTIFVNNVEISTHSSWFLEGSAWVDEPHVPSVYQRALAPLRLLYKANPGAMKSFAARTEGKGAALHEIAPWDLLHAAAKSLMS